MSESPQPPSNIVPDDKPQLPAMTGGESSEQTEAGKPLTLKNEPPARLEPGKSSQPIAVAGESGAGDVAEQVEALMESGSNPDPNVADGTDFVPVAESAGPDTIQIPGFDTHVQSISAFRNNGRRNIPEGLTITGTVQVGKHLLVRTNDTNPQHTQSKVVAVKQAGDTYEITMDDGWQFFVTVIEKPQADPGPQAAEVVAEEQTEATVDDEATANQAAMAAALGERDEKKGK